MSFRIRAATDEDRPALLEQAWQLNIYEEPISHDRRIDKTGAEDTLQATLNRVAKSGGKVLVAEMDGRVVGHLFLSFETHPIYVRPELRPYAYIAELFIREEARDRGIGRALVAEAERIAAERGMDKIMIGVLAGNTMAEEAYARYGFRPYSHELVKPIKR